MNPFSILGPLLPIVVIVIAVTIAIEFFKTRKGDFEEEKPKYNYQKRQFFMTRSESAFYKALVEAVGSEYFIFPQAHLPTMVDFKIPGQDWRAARSHINRTSVDYVLCDKENISPKLAIEYDDSSHEREDRQLRDAEVERILKQSGVALLRIKTSEHGSTEELAQKIRNSFISNAKPH